MIAAHAAAGCEKLALKSAFLTNKRGYFIHEIPVIVEMTASSVSGMAGPIRPGLVVDAVEGEQLNFILSDKGVAGCDHAKIFILVKPAALGWKYYNRFSRGTVYFELHILTQVGAPPFVVFNVHETASMGFLDKLRHGDDLFEVR